MKAMLIMIDMHSKEPIYRQIVEQVRRAVADGRLAPGSELPSLRQLAHDLGVHLNTIALAYRELDRQGIVRLRQGSRATVLAVEPPRSPANPQALDDLREQLVRARTAALLAGLTPHEIWRVITSVFPQLDTESHEG